MIRNCSIGLIAVVAGLALNGPRAQAADESGFVLGTRLGVARYPAAETLVLGPDLELHGGRSDHVDFAWAVAVGYRLNRYLSLSGEVQGTPFSERVSGEDADTILGAGVAYRFADRARLKLDISSFNRVGESEATGRNGIAMAGIGLEWQF